MDVQEWTLLLEIETLRKNSFHWNKIETGIFFLLFNINVVEFNTEHVC